MITNSAIHRSQIMAALPPQPIEPQPSRLPAILMAFTAGMALFLGTLVLGAAVGGAWWNGRFDTAPASVQVPATQAVAPPPPVAAPAPAPAPMVRTLAPAPRPAQAFRPAKAKPVAPSRAVTPDPVLASAPLADGSASPSIPIEPEPVAPQPRPQAASEQEGPSPEGYMELPPDLK